MNVRDIHKSAQNALRRSTVGALLLTALAITACGGGSDSGAGSSTNNGSSSSGGQTTSGGGTESLNNPASGIYASSVRVSASGAGSDYTARLRMVVDQGGGVSIWEDGQLQGQARLVNSSLTSTRAGVTETLFGRRCQGDRRYRASIAGGNRKIEGQLSAQYRCDGAGVLTLSGSFSLPRIGDHQ